MKKNVIFIGLMFFLLLNQGLVKGTTIQPIERSVGKLKISIDPRMELLAVVQSLTNTQDLVGKDLPYTKEIMSYFESFSSQEAVQLTENLQQKYRFGADAPVVFMLHLSQPAELETQIAFSNYLLQRSGEGDNLEQYRKSIKQFAETSNFEAFWDSKIPFYNQILDMTIANMSELDLVKAMEDYFNETQDSYNFIITPAFRSGTGKGPKITDATGEENTYACIATTAIKEGIPYLTEDMIIFFLWHEFGHSFVNPLADKHVDQVMTLNNLFDPVKNQMSSRSYGNWIACVNEHILRATHIRLVDLNLSTQQSKEMIDSELRNSFIYIEPLVEKLKDFEKQRAENNITFSEFYPELLNVLDSLQKIEYWEKFNLNFQGPIGMALSAPKRSIIYPTQGSDTEALKIAQDYVMQFYNTLPPDVFILLADTTALKTDLSEYGIWSFGTIESNLYLKQYASSFPFRIENQTIYADKEYTDMDIKFMSCMPNPHNPKLGMLICTALSNKAFQGIMNLTILSVSGGNDYILFLDDETIISSGVYNNKDDKWTF